VSGGDQRLPAPTLDRSASEDCLQTKIAMGCLVQPVFGHWSWKIIEDVYLVPAIFGAATAVHLSAGEHTRAGSRFKIAPRPHKPMA
jgi:hypothetical protein